MKKSLQLKATREGKIKLQADLLQLARDEAPEGMEMRDFTEDEQKQFDTLESEIGDLDNQIKRAESIEKAQMRALELEAQNPPAPAIHDGAPSDKREDLFAKFSITRAIKQKMNNRELDGAEKEVHQIAVDEARELGMDISSIGLPADMLRATYLTSTPANAGNLMQGSYRPMVDDLLPKLVFEKMGLKVTTGNDKIIIVKESTGFEATWTDEAAAVAEKNNTYTKKEYSEHKLGATSKISREMIFRGAHHNIDARIRASLQRSMRFALERAIANGSGVGNTPKGIGAYSEANLIEIGTDGGVPTWAKMLEMVEKIDDQYADIDKLQYVMTTPLTTVLKQTKKDAGSGLFVLDKGMIDGVPVNTSGFLPRDLVKGSSNDCHQILLGDWSLMEAANFGALDLIVNPYSEDTKALIKITLNSWWDIICDYPEAFSIIADAKTA